MELRDYFAAQALPQVIAMTSNWRSSGGNIELTIDHGVAATHAYKFADAMMAERAK
jgi:hypothetical protein